MESAEPPTARIIGDRNEEIRIVRRARLRVDGLGGAPDWTRAEVVKVDPERSRVILKHELIKSIGMEAMTMPFKADPKVDLKRSRPATRSASPCRTRTTTWSSTPWRRPR
jgi:hypothetical protein